MTTQPARAARLAFLVVSPLVFLGALLVARGRLDRPGDPTLHWDDGLRREVQAIVEERYVDPLDEEDARRLFHGALDGYVRQLDPFSRYVRPEDRARDEQETQGVYGGIGVSATAVPEGLRVTAVREGAPADRAGIEPGDLFEKVAGEPLTGRDRDQVLATIRGEPGTTVEIQVRRGDDVRVVALERAHVPSDTVPSVRLLPGDAPAGYVRIALFADTTAKEVREALAGLVRDGARSVVLDLRQNLGGVVRAADDVASCFLPEGATVCVARRRTGGDVHATRKVDGFEPLTLPLAVLVDEATASASEILAGALQDHGRAVLVGERTWGKFLVQSVVETEAGALVRLTTARYETPRGRSAPRRDLGGDVSGGLVPDVLAEPRDERERQALLAAHARQMGPHWRTLQPAGAEPPDRALEAALALLRGGPRPAETVATRDTSGVR